jgi:hypothetical protein
MVRKQRRYSTAVDRVRHELNILIILADYLETLGGIGFDETRTLGRQGLGVKFFYFEEHLSPLHLRLVEVGDDFWGGLISVNRHGIGAAIGSQVLPVRGQTVSRPKPTQGYDHGQNYPPTSHVKSTPGLEVGFSHRQVFSLRAHDLCAFSFIRCIILRNTRQKKGVKLCIWWGEKLYFIRARPSGLVD